MKIPTLGFKLLLQLAFLSTAIVLIISCNQKNGKGEETGRMSDSARYLFSLRLDTDAYDSLKSYGGKGLVLQYYFPESSTCVSPTLYAYAMEAGEQALGKPPIQLRYDSISSEPFRSRSQVLGNQSIRYASLDSLLSEVKGGYTGKRYYFLFSPDFYPGNPHVFYNVTLQGEGFSSDGSTRSDPSPPYSAF